MQIFFIKNGTDLALDKISFMGFAAGTRGDNEYLAVFKRDVV